MALECAHCGTRSDDGTTRCPRCLRTTHLVAIESEVKPPRPLSRWIVGGVAALALAVAAGMIVRSRTHRAVALPPPEVAPMGQSPLRVESPELRAVAERIRQEHDATARARMAAEMVHQRRTAAVVTDEGDVSPPRGPDLLWRLLPSRTEHVTELDLARLITALLQSAGDTTVHVAERSMSARPDEPMDASGVLGSYVVVSGEHVIEPTQGTLVSVSTVRHHVLTAVALAGAVSAQAALELAIGGAGKERALQYANAAVTAWPESSVPLAARARVWLLTGGTSGQTLAENDLRAAVSLRDDAALHMLLARLSIARDDLRSAVSEVKRAATMAPAWGVPAVALLALRSVLVALDAGTVDACAALRSARAPWTDDAYALCDTGSSETVRMTAARRMLETHSDALRLAYASSVIGNADVILRKTRPFERREAATWLTLFGHPDLAAALLDTDAGTR
jgi:hypothetical protein